ncbi:hypothetical protein C8R43DRAFT_1129329 [Mycena crocata]|nr:hypothetical protein C8R43DRAFT_1129329 [Mycena crocata]
MAPTTPAELDALIKFVLASKLNDSGWTDDMRNRSKERARALEPLSFNALFEEMVPHAQSESCLHEYCRN